MRQMMPAFELGMFGGGGLKSKMLRKMTGMPDMAGFAGAEARCHRCPLYQLDHQEETEKETKEEDNAGD